MVLAARSVRGMVDEAPDRIEQARQGQRVEYKNDCRLPQAVGSFS